MKCRVSESRNYVIRLAIVGLGEPLELRSKPDYSASFWQAYRTCAAEMQTLDQGNIATSRAGQGGAGPEPKSYKGHDWENGKGRGDDYGLE